MKCPEEECSYEESEENIVIHLVLYHRYMEARARNMVKEAVRSGRKYA